MVTKVRETHKRQRQNTVRPGSPESYRKRALSKLKGTCVGSGTGLLQVSLKLNGALYSQGVWADAVAFVTQLGEP